MKIRQREEIIFINNITIQELKISRSKEREKLKKNIVNES